MVRTGSIASAFYSPSNPPNDPNELSRFLFAELQRISAAIQALSLGHLDETTVAPSKPREGDIRFASGAPNWNPGGGRGIYAYVSGVWTKL